MDRKLTLSLGGSHPAEVRETLSLTWPEVTARILGEVPIAQDKASRGWYIPAEFKGDYRDGELFIHRDALTLDYDDISPFDIDDIRAAFKGLAYIMYTTASHTPEKPRVRVVLPTDRSMDYDEFQAVSRYVANLAGIELAARESHVPAQMMFMPTRKSEESECWSEINTGDFVAVDEVLGEYTDWKNPKEWPHRKERDSVYTKDDKGTPPAEKSGIVGDFCRAFDVLSAIQEFNLPYVPTNNENRWTYAHGSRPEGVIIYDDGQKLHSHHDTDPARGQHNAFDLVRLHRFHELDAGFEGSITDAPSYRAMAVLATEHPRVGAARADSEFSDAGVISSDAPAALTEEVRKCKYKVIRGEDVTIPGPREWFVHDVLPKHAELAAFYAPPSAGKSAAVLDITAAVTRGIEEWHQKDVSKGRVVYICAEGSYDFRFRHVAYAKEFGVEQSEMPGVIFAAPNLLDSEDVAHVAFAVKEYGGADIVVIDTWSASIPGADENSSKDAGLAAGNCKWLHKQTGALIIIIAHCGKDASKGIRGWSGILAALDMEAEIVAQGEGSDALRVMTVTKMKGGRDGEQFAFRLKTVDLGLDEKGNPYGSIVAVPADLPAPSERPGRAKTPTGPYETIVFEIAQELCLKGPVSQSVLIAHAVDRLPVGAGEKPNRGVIKKAITALDGKKILHKHGDMYSLSPAQQLEEKDWLDE